MRGEVGKHGWRYSGREDGVVTVDLDAGVRALTVVKAGDGFLLKSTLG